MYIKNIAAESISSLLLASTVVPALILLSMQGKQPVKDSAHHILLIPGLGADDNSMLWLKKHLENSGYVVHDSELTRNEGSFAKQGPQLQALIARISESTGKPVDIVGWSMGGRYACHLAHTNTTQVGKLFLLGSPIVWYDLSPSWESAWSFGLSMTNLDKVALEEELARDLQLPGPEHPVIAITGVFDAVVEMRGSMVPEVLVQQNVHYENIFVEVGHIGLGISYVVLSTILDRLAQPTPEQQSYAKLAA